MDFQELINHADYNVAESKYTGASKKYSSVLPPPKKVPKSNVQSENIKKFLEKKKQEEEAKAAEARRQKEQLLALRAQNSKNNKKAKIMASRTKDNDFSRIKLTEEELEAKKKREAELIRKDIADKVERMKARIEMEEKEKLMPRKRKRKSKNAESVESVDDNHYDDVQNICKDLNSNVKGSTNNGPSREIIRKPRPPPQPIPSFNDLLKIAEKKQYQPVEIPVAKKEEEKLMTKRERKLKEEELARERRKQERLMAESGKSLKPNSVQTSLISKKNTSEKVVSNKPYVIHVNKDVSKADVDGKFKIPKSSASASSNKNIPPKPISNVNSKSISSAVSSEKSIKGSLMNEQKKISKLKAESASSFKGAEEREKGAVPKKNGLKINPVQTIPAKPKLDEAALKAELEKQIREKLEKEMEEKIAAKFAQLQNLQANRDAKKLVEAPKQIKKESGIGNNVVKKPITKADLNNRRDFERMIAMKREAMQQKNLKPKLPEKKTFHMNPYLEPPRRLLEPQRPPRPPIKRRIESDDDEDDEDDMSDFIDDTPSQNEENYSEYIKEIFKYDKSRYVDDDEDEVMESSFAEQMKEEVRSARLGFLEDLEEEKLEKERMKRKKLKKK